MEHELLEYIHSQTAHLSTQDLIDLFHEIRGRLEIEIEALEDDLDRM